MQNPKLGSGEQSARSSARNQAGKPEEFETWTRHWSASAASDVNDAGFVGLRFPAYSEPRFPSTDAAQRSDYEFCLQQLRQSDYGNYLINLLHSSHDSRCAHASLFAFSVQLARIKDAVTNEDMGRLRLSFFRDALQGIYDADHAMARVHGPLQSPTLRALRETIQRFSLPVEPFNLLLSAREADLRYPQPETVHELVKYAQAAHGSCIALHARVLLATLEKPVEQEALAAIDLFATQIGTASGLAVLLRGAPHHAAKFQTYVPRDIMKACNVSVKELVSQKVSVSSNRKKAFQSVAEMAEEYLNRARRESAAWKCVPRACRLAFLPAVLASAYLRRLRSSGYDVYDRRLQLPWTPGTQLRLLLNRMFGTLF
ncbi:hypothetical protein CCYA_CCYA03G1058 [Cyanidiococcus yangmingshanensis]|nr:hypothetical protein CCYA_CCYA03G1058 [Cyanidiococcus yangmingshanensis]